MKRWIFIFISWLSCTSQTKEGSYEKVVLYEDIKNYPLINDLILDKGDSEFEKNLKEAFLIGEGLGSLYEKWVLKGLNDFLEKVDPDFARFLLDSLLKKNPTYEQLLSIIQCKHVTLGFDPNVEIIYKKNFEFTPRKTFLLSMILNGIFFYSSGEEDLCIPFDKFTVKILKSNLYMEKRTCYPLMDSFFTDLAYPLFLSDKTIDFVISIGKCFKVLNDNNFIAKRRCFSNEGKDIIASIYKDLVHNTKYILEDLIERGFYDAYIVWVMCNKPNKENLI